MFDTERLLRASQAQPPPPGYAVLPRPQEAEGEWETSSLPPFSLSLWRTLRGSQELASQGEGVAWLVPHAEVRALASLEALGGIKIKCTVTVYTSPSALGPGEYPKGEGVSDAERLSRASQV